MKHLSLILFIFSFCVYSSNLSDTCKSLFLDNNNKSKEQNVKTSYGYELSTNVYEVIPRAEVLSLKEKQKYAVELKRTIEYINSGHIQTARLQLLEPALLKSVKAFPKIIDFINENQKHSHLNIKQSLEIILSSLTQHTIAYLSHPKTEKDLDFPRFYKILSAIGEFDDKPSAFFLYKIVRSVTEKYSIYEYLNCK